MGILIACIFPLSLAALNNVAQTPTINSLAVTTPKEPITETVPAENAYGRETLMRYVGQKAIEYGLTKEKYQELTYTITGESGWNALAYNKQDERYVKGGSRGPGQFTIPTWKLFNEIRGLKLDIENPLDQLDMMTWAFSTRKENNWSVWCHRFGIGLKVCNWANVRK